MLAHKQLGIHFTLENRVLLTMKEVKFRNSLPVGALKAKSLTNFKLEFGKYIRLHDLVAWITGPGDPEGPFLSYIVCLCNLDNALHIVPDSLIPFVAPMRCIHMIYCRRKNWLSEPLRNSCITRGKMWWNTFSKNCSAKMKIQQHQNVLQFCFDFSELN